MVPRNHVKILVSLKPNHHRREGKTPEKKKRVRATLRRIGRIPDMSDGTACILSNPDLASGTGINSQIGAADSRVPQDVVQALILRAREQVEEMGDNGEISAERSAWYQTRVGDLGHRLWATKMLVPLQ